MVGVNNTCLFDKTATTTSQTRRSYVYFYFITGSIHIFIPLHWWWKSEYYSSSQVRSPLERRKPKKARVKADQSMSLSCGANWGSSASAPFNWRITDMVIGRRGREESPFVRLMPLNSKWSRGASANGSVRLFSMWAKRIPARYSLMVGKLTWSESQEAK